MNLQITIAVATALFVAACDKSATKSDDKQVANTDSGTGSDTGTDSGSDTGTDSGTDTGTDSGSEQEISLDQLRFNISGAAGLALTKGAGASLSLLDCGSDAACKEKEEAARKEAEAGSHSALKRINPDASLESAFADNAAVSVEQMLVGPNKETYMVFNPPVPVTAAGLALTGDTKAPACALAKSKDDGSIECVDLSIQKVENQKEGAIQFGADGSLYVTATIANSGQIVRIKDGEKTVIAGASTSETIDHYNVLSNGDVVLFGNNAAGTQQFIKQVSAAGQAIGKNNVEYGKTAVANGKVYYVDGGTGYRTFDLTTKQLGAQVSLNDLVTSGDLPFESFSIIDFLQVGNRVLAVLDTGRVVMVYPTLEVLDGVVGTIPSTLDPQMGQTVYSNVPFAAGGADDVTIAIGGKLFQHNFVSKTTAQVADLSSISSVSAKDKILFAGKNSSAKPVVGTVGSDGSASSIKETDQEVGSVQSL